MRSKLAEQRGFSLIELAMVVVIVGMVAAVAIPSLLGSKDAAEKAATVNELRSMHTNQITYHTTRGRFARLADLNSFSGNIYGQTSGTTLQKKDWIYLMSPTPTDSTLRSQYQIIAYRVRGNRILSAFLVSQDGVVQTLIP